MRPGRNFCTFRTLEVNVPVLRRDLLISLRNIRMLLNTLEGSLVSHSLLSDVFTLQQYVAATEDLADMLPASEETETEGEKLNI